MTAMRLKRYPSPSGGVALAKMGVGATMLKQGKTARDYVQSGLVAMWDGIENAGWGVHDPNATTWKELIVGSANFPKPTMSTWGVNCLTSSDIDANQYIATNPGTYTSYVSRVDTDYPAIVDMRYDMVMTAEFCFKISGFADSQLENVNRVYYPIAPLGFLNYAEYSYSIWGIRTDGKILLNPYLGWNFNSYGVISRNAITPVASHSVSFQLDGIDSSTGVFNGGIAYNGQSVDVVRGTSASEYKAFRHIDATKPYTFRLNTADAVAWSVIGDIYSIRLYSRALTADEIAHNYAIDKERFNLP